MATDPQEVLGADHQAWHELEGSLAEIAQLAKSDIPLQEFAAELLERTVRMLAAIGGAIWLVDGKGSLHLASQTNLEMLPASGRDSSQGFRHDLVDQVLRSGQSQVVPPRSPRVEPNSSFIPTDSLMIFCPSKIDQDVAGVVEVVQRPTSDAAAIRGNRRLVSMVCELLADYLQHREIRALRRRQVEARRFEQFVEQVHAKLDLRGTAYQLVNEGRRYIGCDRVSVVIRRGQRFELLATSGIDTIHRRSNAARCMENVAAVVARTDEPLWYCGDSSERPPQIEERIRLYVDQTHAKTFALIQLRASLDRDGSTQGTPVGVLIVEQFANGFDEEMEGRVTSVANQGALALKNALDYQSLPALPFARSRWWAEFVQSGRLPRATLTLPVVALAIALLALVPADFNIEARGTLQPQQQRDVFAPVDGEIVDLPVRHGDDVAAGDVLLVLRSPEIDLELQRTRGEFATTRKRLLAVEAALLQGNPAEVRIDSRPGQLAAEHEELKQRLETQQKQLQLLRAQEAKLKVRSPIAGRVLTWSPDQMLEDRPVQRGQALLTVANTAGPWVIELHVPDDRIGFVLDAQDKQGVPPTVTFELATSRGVVHSGAIRQIASRTELAELTEEQQPTVKVTVGFDETVASLRPGTTVFAEISCGRKPLGYVWLHDLVDAVRTWLFF